MVVVDGSLFDALPRMVWAMYQPKNGNHKFKLHFIQLHLIGVTDEELIKVLTNA
jgi:hypothetical protein